MIWATFYFRTHKPNSYVHNTQFYQETIDKSIDESTYPIYLGPETSMDPKSDELLSDPINLKNCPGLQIIEWRASDTVRTRMDPPGIAALNQTCERAFKAFPGFVKARNLTPIKSEPFQWFVCLMPGLQELGGTQARNLNDSLDRFKDRAILSEGFFYGAWTAHQRKKIFMRNDIYLENGSINPKLITIFSHELFHAMSWHYKIFENSEKDEMLAVEFTEHLGLGI